ncbi:hypothetical protein [Deinococcus misasensis]|uniref:hypothetical protein n=1 Tax=Deinococcus misasensis TaxID=392413 RepID=UPI000A7712CC|nr:hypothetical protein [Deinococcus misasensis]
MMDVMHPLSPEVLALATPIEKIQFEFWNEGKFSKFENLRDHLQEPLVSEGFAGFGSGGRPLLMPVIKNLF